MLSHIHGGKKEILYFQVWKMWKKIAISSKYNIPKFLGLFNFFLKDHEKSALLLRKDVIVLENTLIHEKN